MKEPENLVDRRVLESLLPIRELKPLGFRELSEKTVVEEQPVGRVLFKPGAVDNWIFYLLDGEVELLAGDGTSETIEGGTGRAKLPLVRGRSDRLTASCKTDIKFIRIDSDLLEVLLGEGETGGYEVAEIQAGDELLENKVFNRIYHEYMDGALTLPGIPDIAIRVRHAIQDPRNDISAVAKIVQVDPALTARLIQVANSPLYRAQAPIDNCRTAITRLGLSATRNLVISFSLHGVFRCESSLLRKRMSELWRHSSHTAALSFVLASRTPGFDSDRAMLAGLVHDIGILPILVHVEQYLELAVDLAALDKAISALRGQIGAMVLRKWRFSSDLVTVALEAEEWFRNPGPRPDYCDIVLIGQLHSLVGTPQMQSCPNLNEVPAFSKLALGELSPGLSLTILDEARRDIAEVLQLLMG